MCHQSNSMVSSECGEREREREKSDKSLPWKLQQATRNGETVGIAVEWDIMPLTVIQ